MPRVRKLRIPANLTNILFLDYQGYYWHMCNFLPYLFLSYWTIYLLCISRNLLNFLTEHHLLHEGSTKDQMANICNARPSEYPRTWRNGTRNCKGRLMNCISYLKLLKRFKMKECSFTSANQVSYPNFCHHLLYSTLLNSRVVLQVLSKSLQLTWFYRHVLLFLSSFMHLPLTLHILKLLAPNSAPFSDIYSFTSPPLFFPIYCLFVVLTTNLLNILSANIFKI